MAWETQKDNKKEEKEDNSKVEFTSLAEAEEKRGLKIGLYGDFGTGKTHFALTAPEPIYIIDTEMGAAPLAHLFKDKDIKILDVAEENGAKSYEKMASAIEYISQQEKVGTVIIDSVTDFWEFAQEYGKVNIFKIKPEARLAQQWDWGVINKLYLSIILKLLKLNCNLILTARESEVYAGAGQPMGVYKPKWQKNTGFWVDFVLYNTKKANKDGSTIFTSTIEKSRPAGELMGKKFNNFDFKNLEEELQKYKK